MSTRKYILEGRTPVPTDDLMLWGQRFELDNRHVAVTIIGPYRISTVFLGIDHQFGGGPPLLFETMVFDAETTRSADGFGQWRCSTWEQAEQQHQDVTREVRDKLAQLAAEVDKILKPGL